MGVEFMKIELSVKSNKWKLCYIYRPLNEKVFVTSYLNYAKHLLLTALFVCFSGIWIAICLVAIVYLMSVTFLVLQI